ncbi:hypothetical protein M378DRAFT_166117 [Amanita muscaria Koide BX008]|uniref:DUF6534 domain-containing protein n=1 Tax=Amanita muscaria (strain Koide BX008) TaxID=946122 RepID=A0A0C2X0C7_AMAMK|nr:hypothetical protein M378DRAFT_166117 [Amanita muscaria Koide BX008]
MSAQPLALDDTLGAVFIGIVVASSLHGVSCLQAWFYFTHQNDTWPTKALVSAVMIFDTIHQMLITHTAYIYLIKNFGNYPALENIVWSLIVEVIFNGLTALLVQSFLANRVWRLSNRNIWITGLVAILIVGEFVSVVVFLGLSVRFRTFTELATLKSLSVTINALAAAGDVLIAVTLCILLHRSRTGFHRSNTMINKLIMFAVNTGCFTSLCALASLISITVAGTTFFYIAFFFSIGRLYSNSLLATLNARDMIRNATDGIESTDDKFSVSLREMPKTATIGSRRPTNISIKIDTTKEFATDRDSDQEQENAGENARRSSIDQKGDSTVTTGYTYKEDMEA